MSTVIYKEIIPPTGATRCAAAFFTHLQNAYDLPDLLLARSTRIEIYTPRVSKTSDSSTSAADFSCRLELIAAYPLNGVVESLAVLRSRTPDIQRDSLLLTFRDAKLCVLDWDETEHCIRTSSLHYLEGLSSMKEARVVFPMPPKVLADPQGRCAAVLCFDHQLVMLPALEADQFDFMGIDSSLKAATASCAGAVGNSFVINLNKKGLGLQSVRDAAFLYGYTQPTVLVLHEPEPTWVGRYRDKKDTCALVAISLSLRRQRYTKLWSADALPSTSFAILALPDRPAALVLSMNHIMYYSQGQSSAVAVNSFAFPGILPPKLEFNLQVEAPHLTAARLARELAINMHPEVVPAVGRNLPAELKEGLEVEVELDGAPACWLSDSCCLVCAKNGQQLAVHVKPDAPAEERLKVVPASNTVVASDACTLGDSLVFIASWSGDSLLMHYSSETASDSSTESASKRQRVEGEDSTAGIASTDKVTDPNAAPKVQLKVLDSLHSFGPVRDMLHLDTSTGPSSSAQDEAGERGGPTVYALTGQDRTGAVSILRQGLLPEVITEVPLSGVTGLWSIHHRQELMEDGDSNYHAYLLLSKDGMTTMVLQTGEELEEVTEKCAYITDQATVCAGNLFNNAGIIQVCPEALRVYDGMEPIQDLTIEDLLMGSAPSAGVKIRAAQICDPYVLLHMSNGMALLLEGDPEYMTLGFCTAAMEVLSSASIGPLSLITACCIYTDETGWLEKASTKPQQAGRGETGTPPREHVEDGDDGAAADAGAHASANADADAAAEAVPGLAFSPVAEQVMLPPGTATAACAAAGPGPGSEAGMERDASCSDANANMERPPPSPPAPPMDAPPAPPPPPVDGGDEDEGIEDLEFEDDDGDGGEGVDADGQDSGQGDDAWMEGVEEEEEELDYNSEPEEVAAEKAQVADEPEEVAAEKAQVADEPEEVAAEKAQVADKPAQRGGETEGEVAEEAGWEGAAQVPQEPELAAAAHATASDTNGAGGDNATTGEMAENGTLPNGGGEGGAAEGQQGLDQEDAGQDAFMYADQGTPEPPPKQYLAITRRTGCLELYCLSDMKLVLACEGLPLGPNHLVPSTPGSEDAAAPANQMLLDSGRIVEIRLESFKVSHGPGEGSMAECERPVLLALSWSGDLLAYQAFQQPVVNVSHESSPAAEPQRGALEGATPSGRDADIGEVAEDEQLGSAGVRNGIAFARLNLDWSSHQEGTSASGMPSADRMVRFDALAWSDPYARALGPSQSGVFVCGSRPVWLTASRGSLVQHPMHIEGPITAMTPFHNINCPNGFIISCSSGVVKVCQLPYKARLDTHWVSTKVALKATPHKMAHYSEGNLLAVAVSRSMPYRPRVPEEPGGDAHAAAMYATSDAAPKAVGREEGFEIRLLELPGCPASLASRPMVLQPGEAATSLRTVYLKSTSTENVEAMLAVGTGYMLGEDYPSLGRVVLYQLERVARDLGGGNIERVWTSKQVYQREFQGPVTSVQDFKGFLLVSVSNKVEMYTWTGSSLNKHAFYDAPMMITSLNIIKDYILVGDVHHGVYFIRYVEADRVLSLLGKDFDQHDVVSTGIIINATKLLFVFADTGGTIRQMEYMRNHPSSWGGLRLLPKGALHTGHTISKMLSMKLPSADGANRHALLFGTAAGGFGYLAPIPDAASGLRLAGLQKILALKLPPTGGLNPTAFRRRYLRIPRPLGGGRDHGKPLTDSENGILDGDLIWRFADLPRDQQAAIASETGGGAGTSPTAILKDLNQLALVTTF